MPEERPDKENLDQYHSVFSDALRGIVNNLLFKGNAAEEDSRKILILTWIYAKVLKSPESPYDSETVRRFRTLPIEELFYHSAKAQVQGGLCPIQRNTRSSFFSRMDKAKEREDKNATRVV